MSKKIILIVIIAIVAIFAIYQGFLKKEKPTFTLAEVSLGNISQEVSETGQVKKGEEINLSFKSAGRIEKIYVEVGDKVGTGESLARLKTTQLQIQLQEAKAALSVVQAGLDKLLTGATPEEIKVAETNVKNFQISLDTAKENLENSYQDGLNVLDSSYLKAYNAQSEVDSIQRTYFSQNDQQGIKVKENADKITTAVSQTKSYLEKAKAQTQNENIDLALSETKKNLDNIYDSLEIIREVCEGPVYRNIVSSTDKTSLDTYRTNINTAITNITNSQQSITSDQFSVDSAKGNLQAAQDELDLLVASPRQEDIDLYRAQVNQAQAQVNLLGNQIEEATLKSPVNGQVTKINKREGELVLQDVIIALLPSAPFEIEVNIYEEDVVKVDINNPVGISLVAFPEEIFEGKVISIDPAEKLIEGVVYYEVTIAFENLPGGVRPGMTADLVIKTAEKENVLMVPEDVIQKKDGKKFVEVLVGEKPEEREVETGLLGSDDLIEIISGLNEGDQVIIP